MSASDVGEVRLEITGGIAGVHDSVVVDPDGMVLIEQSGSPARRQPLDAAELDHLRALVVSREFMSLDDTYEPAGLCCDQLNYSVSADIDGRTVRSSTADGIEAPDVLEEVIGILAAALT